MMDSTYVEMAVANCSSEIGQCNNFAASATSLASYSSSSPMMHSLESTLNVANTNLQPDSSKEMPPPSTIPGVTPPMFSTVEFSGFSQAACDANDSVACGSPAPKNSGSASSSASSSAENQAQVHMVTVPGQVTSQAIFQHPSSEGSVQYFQSHLSDQRPGSVSASPGPPGSCGSGGSPAPSTSLSHPSVGSPWSFDAGSQPNCETPAAMSHTATTVMASAGYPSQVSETVKSEKPMPPKKPLTPYMRFSKSIWQTVKAANPSLSVCEVGATIGRMWREMNETDKQRYNDDFVNDKVRYDGELQSYLKVTGLQASDLVRPKAKKKDTKDKTQTPARPTKPQAPQYGTTESGNSGISAMGDQATEPLSANVTSAGTFNGSTGDTTLQAAGFQNMGVGGEECGGGVGLGSALGTLPHFSQVWAGQDVYANPQLLAQMGMTTGQTIYANQTMSDSLNASGLITIQPQDVNQNDGQMATMYSQSQSSQQVGNQCVPAHQNVQLQQMSVEGLSDSLTSSLGQTDNTATMTSNDNTWLWQQYNAGNQFVQDALTQSSGPQAQSHEGVIIYQLTSDGTQSSLVRSSMESGIQTNHNIPMTLMAKQAGAGDGNMETVLEPGEVPLSSQLQVASNGPIDAGLYDLNQLYGLTQWNQVKDEKMDFAQPVDGEKQLLRSALFEKTKEIQRLTKELEMAYGLIHHLKQESNNYQRHWDSQQQQQQQQQQQLHILPKGCTNTDSGTGISISS